MAAWLVALLLLGAPGIDAGDLDALVKRSKVPRARLGIAVGPVGAGPLYVIHPKTPRIPVRRDTASKLQSV